MIGQRVGSLEQGLGNRGRVMPPLLCVIEVIHAALSTSIIAPRHKGMMTIATLQDTKPEDWLDK